MCLTFSLDINPSFQKIAFDGNLFCMPSCRQLKNGESKPAAELIVEGHYNS